MGESETSSMPCNQSLHVLPGSFSGVPSFTLSVISPLLVS